MLTWSLGWTGSFEPMVPPRISIARLAMTSLAFMFDCVPEPVCHTTSGKWSSSLPEATSEAASITASAIPPSSLPRSRLASAQARLITPSAWTMAAGWRSQPMGKFIRLRWVWAPQ